MSHEAKVLQYWADRADSGEEMFSMDDQIVMAKITRLVLQKHFNGSDINTHRLFDELDLRDEYLAQLSSEIDSVMNPDPVELEDCDYLDEDDEDELGDEQGPYADQFPHIRRLYPEDGEEDEDE